MGQIISVTELYSGANGAIVRDAILTTDAIDLRKLRLDGYFSLHTIHVGGTLTISIHVCSTLKGTYMAPTVPIVLGTALAAGSYFISFEPPLAPFMKILFDETNTAACTSLKAWLNMQ